MRFVNSKKTWMLSSLFALMMAGSSLMGAETNQQDVKPEIRTSQTQFVQPAKPAAERLKTEVENDGGSVEEGEVQTAGEKANAAIQEAADVVYGAGNTGREYLAEKGREYLGRPGEAAGQLVGGLAQGVTAVGGALTQGAGYATEGVTDSAVWTYNNALKPAYNLTVDGGEAVYDATKNFVIKTAPEAIADGWTWTGDQLKKFGDSVVGLFSSDEEKPAETQTQAEQQVEEPTPEAQPEQTAQPAPEQVQPEPAQPEVETPTAGDEVIETVNQAANAVYGAGDTANDYLRDKLGPGLGDVAGGLTRVGTGVAGLTTQGAGYVAGAATDAYNATVKGGEAAYDATKTFVMETAPEAVADGLTWTGEQVKKVGDSIAEVFSSDEGKPAAPQPQTEQQAEEPVPEAQPEQTEQPKAPEAQEVAEEGPSVGEEIYTKVNRGLAEFGQTAVKPVLDKLGKMFPARNQEGEAEQTQTAPAAPQPQPEQVVQPTAEDDLSEIWGGTKNFFTETIPEVTVDGLKKTGEKLEEFGASVAGLFQSGEKKPVEPQAQAGQQVEEPTPEAQPEQIEQPKAPEAQEVAEEGPSVGERIYTGVDNVLAEFGQTTVKPVLDRLGKMFPARNQEGEAEQTQTAPEAQPEQVAQPKAPEQVQPAQPSFWDKITGLFGSKDRAGTTSEEKPTGLTEQPKVVTMMAPAGAKEAPIPEAEKTTILEDVGNLAKDIHQTMMEKVYKPAMDRVSDAFEKKPADMTKLTEFLKSKGLSDADIQTAVGLAQGKEDGKAEPSSRTTSGLRDALTQPKPATPTQRPTYELTGKKLDTTITIMNDMYSRNDGR